MSEEKQIIAVAKVDSFFGARIVAVTDIVFCQGKVERIHGVDGMGKSYKFKNDEEPITILWVSGA
jgi:hypothetical protein